MARKWNFEIAENTTATNRASALEKFASVRQPWIDPSATDRQAIGERTRRASPASRGLLEEGFAC